MPKRRYLYCVIYSVIEFSGDLIAAIMAYHYYYRVYDKVLRALLWVFRINTRL